MDWKVIDKNTAEKIENEAQMQKMVVDHIKRKYPNWNIQEEKAIGLNTADIVISKDTEHTIMELKMKPCKKLLQQLKNHSKYADYLVAIAMKPKKDFTIAKWENEFRKHKINVVWIEYAETFDLDDKNFIKNTSVKEQSKYINNLKSKCSDTLIQDDLKEMTRERNK